MRKSKDKKVSPRPFTSGRRF